MPEIENNPPAREMTFGEKTCGVSFNPGGNPDVAAIKAQFAALVDDLAARSRASGNQMVVDRYERAIDKLEEAQMLAVKAVTWQF